MYICPFYIVAAAIARIYENNVYYNTIMRDIFYFYRNTTSLVNLNHWSISRGVCGVCVCECVYGARTVRSKNKIKIYKTTVYILERRCRQHHNGRQRAV